MLNSKLISATGWCKEELMGGSSGGWKNTAGICFSTAWGALIVRILLLMCMWKQIWQKKSGEEDHAELVVLHCFCCYQLFVNLGVRCSLKISATTKPPFVGRAANITYRSTGLQKCNSGGFVLSVCVLWMTLSHKRFSWGGYPQRGMEKQYFPSVIKWLWRKYVFY